ncbi:DeoR/GlpR family DNA-binding transcription regulator [Jeongeupia wiesaeckerbachi]|uniref:DeoR/GlpR family DNA-binding transcription regulator n=1 Tax=Jeongeupia wiesaeckerbachi TaxID=3051218 RepID=UPI003D803327
MLPRHRQIIECVRRLGDVSIDTLARTLGVSPQTIRRDIGTLESERLLVRYHGGVSLPSSIDNIDYRLRQTLHLDAKQRIAALVARHLAPGRSLLINIGTTTEEVAKALIGHAGLRVVTNNLNVAAILSGNGNANVIIAGGQVRAHDRGIVGEATIEFIRQYRVDVGIIGISAIDDDGTLLDYDDREVRVTQAILAQSREVWLVADHSKFTRRAMMRVGPLSAVDKFFTDRPLPDEIAATLHGTNTEVFIAATGMAEATSSA